MNIKLFKPVTIMYKNLIPVAKTRFPWFHKNFSGISGWKQDFIKELEDKMAVDVNHRGTTKVLFKAFGCPVMLDSGKAEFWKLPKFIQSGSLIRAGWLYWAIEIIRSPVYYTPKKIITQYEFLSDENNLRITLQEGMRSGDTELVMDAMDIMLKLDYSHFRIQFRVISKSGDRIQYIVTYPRTRLIIESVNGIQNQVLAAKYHHMLSTGELENRTRNLLHKDDMTLEQLDWLGEDD